MIASETCNEKSFPDGFHLEIKENLYQASEAKEALAAIGKMDGMIRKKVLCISQLPNPNIRGASLSKRLTIF